ncbi:MAG: beta-lactamase family protein [Ardenticatenales bacterium]|nr:beta-lactamase family protein [Ardenticatenales bacterium]
MHGPLRRLPGTAAHRQQADAHHRAGRNPRVRRFRSRSLPAGRPPPHPQRPPTLTRALDRILTRAFDADTPGAAVLVTQRGHVLYAAARGLADRRTRVPIDIDTAFHAGSVGKQFTALAVLMLVDDDLLALDDPIGAHLPELRKLGRGVTLRRLLGHTAGIPDVYDALYDVASAAEAEDAAAPGAPRNADLVAAVATAIDGPDDLDFAPGTAYAYSNTGYDLLGAAIERASGQAYGDFLAARVFVPLGMTGTFAWDAERLATAHRARGYAPTSAGGWKVVDHDPLDALNGSGSIYTTVADLYRYEQGLRAGTLLSAASAAEWTSPATLADGTSTDYALGWEVWQQDDGEPVISHDGLWLGYSAYVARFPERDLMVAVLCNNADADPETVAWKIAAELD